MKLPYKEGSVFLVTLTDGGYARGVVARAGRKGGVLMGYFFGPRLTSPQKAELTDLAPDNAVLRLLFGDLRLINGKWPIIGNVPNWDRSEWPMPDFVLRDVLGCQKRVVVRYADDDPLRIEAEYTVNDASGMPIDSVSGAALVEIKLTELLGHKQT